jgi:hypothetical protein
MAICPNGHDSVTDDVCAVCGARIATSPVRVVGRHHAGGPPLAGGRENTCPWCGNPSSGQFCAQCGFRVRRPFAPPAEPAPSPSVPDWSAATSWSAVPPAPAAPVSAAPVSAAPVSAAPVSAAPVSAEDEPEPPAFMDWFSPAERTQPAEPPAAFELAESLDPPEPIDPPEPADLPVASSAPPTAPMPKYTPTTWSVVVTSDRDYFDRMQLKRALTSSAVAFPVISSERRFELSGKQMRIGRRSPARGVEPEIDLSGSPVDPGVSRLHALLLPGPDGSWALLDPGSANGTLLNGSEVTPGDLIPLHDGDRINLGAWTAITVCRG